MIRGVHREKTREQPSHATPESGQARTENADIEFYVTPKGREGAFVGNIFRNRNGVDPDKAQDRNDAGAG